MNLGIKFWLLLLSLPATEGRLGNADDVTSDQGIKGLSVADGRRSLAMTPVMDHDNMYKPLACNENANPSITSQQCLDNGHTLSSLIASSASTNSPLIVPCGECYIVDTTDGSTVTLPGDGSLHVKGRLHFPSTSSLTLNTTAVFVEGHFDIGIPDLGKKVKISFYGTEEQYYYPHMMCTLGDRNCEHKKKVGKKPFVVAGGTLDIRAIDKECPSWTTLKDVGMTSNGRTNKFHVDTSFARCLRVGDEMLITSDSYGGWDKHFDWKVASIDVTNGILHMEGSTDRVFATEAGPGEAIFAAEVALLRRDVIFEGQTPLRTEIFKFNRVNDVLDLRWKSDAIESVSADFSESIGNDLLLQFWDPLDDGRVEVTYREAVTAKWSYMRANSATCTVQLEKNGSVVGTLPQGQYVTTTTTVDVMPGDHVTLKEVGNCIGVLLSLEHTKRSLPDDPSDPNSTHGGHLMILHTNHVVQTIEGVEFDNMGQTGNLGRYPIHFHMCGDAHKSSVSRNVIRNSLQRCVVIHNSNGVVIEDNVSYKTRGHCYVTEDHSEVDNHFIHNLGVQVDDLDGDNGQSDSVAFGSATFWIRNAKNYFEGNVAAGALSTGYWFDMVKTGTEKYAPLYSFNNNAVHSSAAGIISYPGGGFTPGPGAVLNNTRVYKNTKNGFLHFFSGGFKILNSVIADNFIGIQDSQGHADTITIEDTQIIGLSEDMKIRFGQTTPKPQSGLEYAFNVDPADKKTVHYMPQLKNVTFKEFSGDSQAISPYAEIVFGAKQTMDDPVLAEGVIFDNTVEGASRDPLTKDDLAWTNYFEDVTGTFSPTGKPGFFVQNTKRMTHFIPETCSSIPSKSSKGTVFCENACLQHMLIIPENWHLQLYKKMVLDNGFTSYEYSPMDSYNLQTFDVLLPPGNYIARFKDSADKLVVPPSMTVMERAGPYREGCGKPIVKCDEMTGCINPTPPPTSPPFVMPNVDPLVTIPDAEGFQLAYSLDIPTKPMYQSFRPQYSVDNHKDITFFSRIAYYLELDDSYVWVSMNAFTDDAARIGVPCLSKDCADGMHPTVIQQMVANVNVVSNVDGLTGNGLSGNVEFWPYNFNPTNKLGISGASSGTFDIDDTPEAHGEYGSMQVHVNGGGNYKGTVFALNRFNDGHVADIGIGSNAGTTGFPDWTLAENADKYTLRRIRVYILGPAPDPTAAPVEAPTKAPTKAPVVAPTDVPTNAPVQTIAPTIAPTKAPVPQPTNPPTITPTKAPVPTPTNPPTITPTKAPVPTPTNPPTITPTKAPVPQPTNPPTITPTKAPVPQPTNPPTITPTKAPVPQPTNPPTTIPTEAPVLPPTSSPVSPPTTAPVGNLAIPNIPDSAGFQIVYSLQIPEKPKYELAGPDYAIDKHKDLLGFSRVAYYLELDNSYVWVSMDAFTDDAGIIGVPCLSLQCGDGQTRTVIQQIVSNANVVSNVPGLTGSALTGNLEFWPYDYTADNSIGIPGASSSAFDHGDMPRHHGKFGSMQVHINGGGSYTGTVFAFNSFNDGTRPADLGIGNKPGAVNGLGPDWSLAMNAGQYTARNLKVFVYGATSANTGGMTTITTNPIPDSVGYNLAYELDIPDKPKYRDAAPVYSIDNHASLSGFSRIAYHLELDNSYVWVSMDAFTNNVKKIGVPCLNSKCGDGTGPTVIQEMVYNMNVQSSVPGLDGTGLSGNLEFWPYDYSADNSANVPGASQTQFDFGDKPQHNGSFGSMQIHINGGSSYKGTVFAFNRFNDGFPADLGIGNHKTGDSQYGLGPDWSLAMNSEQFTVRKLRIYVK